MMGTPRLLATFRVGETWLVIDAGTAQEVLRGQEVYPVPGTEPSVLGLMNLRGQVVTTIDLARRMGLRRQTSLAEAFHVVVRTGEEAVSLIVDDVGQVLDASDLVADPPPDTLHPDLRRLISGVHQQDDVLLMVLDVEAATRVDLEVAAEPAGRLVAAAESAADGG